MGVFFQRYLNSSSTQHHSHRKKYDQHHSWRTNWIKINQIMWEYVRFTQCPYAQNLGRIWIPPMCHSIVDGLFLGVPHEHTMTVMAIGGNINKNVVMIWGLKDAGRKRPSWITGVVTIPIMANSVDTITTKKCPKNEKLTLFIGQLWTKKNSMSIDYKFMNLPKKYLVFFLKTWEISRWNPEFFTAFPKLNSCWLWNQPSKFQNGWKTQGLIIYQNESRKLLRRRLRIPSCFGPTRSNRHEHLTKKTQKSDDTKPTKDAKTNLVGGLNPSEKY